jgi:hypothetical protein
MRPRSIAVLISLAEFSKSSSTDLWSPRMVKAVESVAKLHKWQVYCRREGAHVTMFEPACIFFIAQEQREPDKQPYSL